MSGVLQRLVGQAAGAVAPGTGSNAGRIRSAASVHASVPLTSSPRDEAGMASPPLHTADGYRESAIDPRSPPREKALREPEAAARVQTPERGLDVKSAPSAAAQSRQAVGSVSPDTALTPRQPATSATAPARLLGEVAAPRAATAISANNSERRLTIEAPRAAVRTPTEVHVHIGRLEVRTTTDPAPKKPRAPATRPTRGLSEYLARGRS